MENVTSIAGIKKAIEQLENDQVEKGKILKEQLSLTYEHLKPVNIVKSTIRELSSSPDLIGNLADNSFGIASGYFTKKIIIGSSGNTIRKLIGSIAQIGVTNFVSHSGVLKSLGQIVIQHFINKKEKRSNGSAA